MTQTNTTPRLKPSSGLITSLQITALLGRHLSSDFVILYNVLWQLGSLLGFHNSSVFHLSLCSFIGSPPNIFWPRSSHVCRGESPSFLLPTFCEPFDAHQGTVKCWVVEKWRGGEADLIISQLDTRTHRFDPHPPLTYTPLQLCAHSGSFHRL